MDCLQYPNVTALMSSLLEHGPRNKFHVVAATHSSNCSEIQDWIKHRFMVRIIGKINKRMDAIYATARGSSGATDLFDRNDFLAIMDDDVVHFSTTHIDKEDLEREFMSTQTTLR
jgi:hypothetical protein